MEELNDIAVENEELEMEHDDSPIIPGMAQPGKYLTFALGEEDYGLEILAVREIIGLMEITPVPKTPSYVQGVINLRGKVISVIDLRSKFGMPTIEYTSETCIIVVQMQNIHIGVIIDRVKEVLDITRDQIEPSPNFGCTIDSDFIMGIGKIEDNVKILLDISKVLCEDLSLASQSE